MDPKNQTQGTPNTNGENQGSDAVQNKGVAIVSRIPVLFWVPLLAAKNSPFAMYHANQGLLHLLAHIVISTVLTMIPIFGWMLLPVLQIVSLVVMIMGIIQASKGEMKPIPVIGKYKILG